MHEKIIKVFLCVTVELVVVKLVIPGKDAQFTLPREFFLLGWGWQGVDRIF